MRSTPDVSKLLPARLGGAFLLTALISMACAPPPPASEETPTEAVQAVEVPQEAPRLVLFLVVDQARYDYLERFRPLLRGGLARLLDEGLSFTDAHHAHALTATGPGHATLATGTHPAQHGVIGNGWLDRETGASVYCAEDADDRPSPAQLLRPTLGDRMKAAWPEARVFTAAGKDRAAILTAGKDADAAFWYDRDNGRFTTSSFYLGVAPAWFDTFHDRRMVDTWFGQPWEPLPATREALATPSYGLAPLRRAPIESAFPHALGSASPAPDDAYYSDVIASPFIETYLVDFALALIDGEQLGRDGIPDFLGLGFSSLDYIGHDYGPDAPETLDALLRLDLELARLLDGIEERIGLDAVLVSLSSDHGVMPIPEVARARSDGSQPRRLNTDDVLCLQRAGQAVVDELGGDLHTWFFDGFYLDPAQLERQQVEAGAVQALLRQRLEACDAVARAWTYSELAAASVPATDSDLDEYRVAFRHGFHPERSADVTIQFAEHVLYTRSSETSHGSPYPHDSHVPWLLRLPGPAKALAPRRIDERVHTTDVAATIAARLGLPIDGMDGQDRGPFEPASESN